MTNKTLKHYVGGMEKALVGIDRLHFSPLLFDVPDAIGYGDMYDFANTISIAVNVSSVTETLYADNKAAIVYATVGGVEVTINKTHLTDEVLALLLGSPTKGATRYLSGEANSPYIGIAWRQSYSDGTYAYLKLYKGKFTEPSIQTNTKGESVEFQTRELAGKFASTNFLMKDGDKEFTAIMASVEDSHDDYADEGKTWFDNIMPTTAPKWVADTAYSKGAYVEHENKYYVAKETMAGSATFEEAKWEKVGK